MSVLKNIVKPEKIPVDYWKKILWVAEDLRKLIPQNKYRNLKLLEAKDVTLLFVKPHGRFHLAFSLACNLLSARKIMYYDTDFENELNPDDSIKVLSFLTDMFIVHGLQHSILKKVVKGATVPVFPAGTDTYCLHKTLSDMLSYYGAFNHLTGLTVAWVGPPNAIFNSYLVLCSKFRMKFQYTLMCMHGTGKMSSVHKMKFKNMKEELSVTEFKTAEETVTGANIVVTSMHPYENNQITLEMLKKSAPDYVFMHTLPRSKKEVAPEVFGGKNDLTWKTTENYIYVAMAIILTSLKDYTPTIPMPNF